MSTEDLTTLRADVDALKKQMLENSLHDLRLLGRVDALQRVLAEVAVKLGIPQEEIEKLIAEATEEATFARLSKLEDVSPSLAANVSALLKEEESPPDLKGS